MIGLLGRKVGMTQVFDEEGHAVPITVLQVGPCVVTRLRTKEKDGYVAVQLGFGEQKEKSLTKPVLGYFKKIGLPVKKFLREIRTNSLEGLEVGKELKADQFEVGEFVDVEGISIGKGFQGVVKRHHFKGGPKSHGSMFGRVAGSIGASSFPSRVVKGMRMPGQMGNQQVTIQNLKVIKVDPENNLLVVKGSVPGAETGCLVIRTSVKRGKAKQWKVAKAEQEKPQEKAEKPEQDVQEKAQQAA
ncbi:MAG: 50S ribosomal protein L3 [Candidatus Omnitrophica bacterium]|nr:50S ribosomal protein L3 [Candidatus Omnitrophota bacterium]